ncbi:asparagine synthase (glutamine-hydrolyzing) [Pontibacillus sp. HMF3514]|uniref:asparagine synthase (glutamine-hydrolyzing) n=1 Tax=Pontibacillus sp. HMF3514 TaxID=2692425 RepID=UPI00131FC60D|nr:asparagine synthase (glutamine-hydrolyzing) [Pontibacillus sp. HMF3514]QHE53325.1 asparagine synthase (glutamine-hydrolyzing) [Pontibacillus sp. HMF3514]
MCGFIGVIRHNPFQLDEQEQQQFKRRNDIITHRGPDDEGYYHDEYISFGFRRLSIIDIESGHQPFNYEDERYWMVFNGEVYNYVELRDELIKEGYEFETESDTEVIIAMFRHKKEEAFARLRGMFAILIWDKQEQTFYGARDPFGIKPLFYSEQNDQTYFASEKKSITLLQENELVNTEALQHYLSFQYVPEPLTLTDGISKVEPGHYFVKKPQEKIRFTRFWHSTFTQVQGEESQWIKRIQDVMYDSVNVHMRSDVPVGSFLSGGIDSSIIVAMAREFNPNIKTFSVGFEREGFSEVDVAKETAEKLGVENISYTITPEEYVQKLPKIMWHMDDPLADPACVPLYFVAREARKHVTVVLSGEGADELFGGYNIYREPESLKMFDSIPKPAKGLLSRVAEVLPEGVKGKSFLERGTTPLHERYIGNAKMYEEDEKKKLLKDYYDQKTYQSLTGPLYKQVQLNHPVNQMQYIDIHTWLRGDILLKADKMTMANSLELRVPFLDKEVFNVAREIPVDMKIADGTTKSILRKAARGIVPDHVLDRKKLGFPVPIRHWLKNELYDWAKTLIRESETDHLIEKQVVSQLLEDHVNGKGDYSRKIWTVLMFMLWHQIFIERKYPFEDLVEEDKSISKLTIT